MARPRKPEDPQRWPIACARCNGHYELVATWPDGPICGYCYQAAKRTTGICACGHQGVLPGLIDDRPACRRCSGVKLNVDCVSCGDEAELYSGGRCQRCVLSATATRLLTNPDTGFIAPQLQVIVDALTAMQRPNSGLTWIRQSHVQSVLRELALHPTLTHEVLDQLPAGRTTDYMRNLLVEHAVLPSRDERLARFQAWAVTAQQRLTTEEHRNVLARFIRWSLEKRLRSMNPVTDSAFLRAKQSVTVTIEFCNWLATEQRHHRRSGDAGPHRFVASDRAHHSRAHPAFHPMGHQGQTCRFRSGGVAASPRQRTEDVDRTAERRHRTGCTPADASTSRPSFRDPDHRLRPARRGRRRPDLGQDHDHRRHGDRRFGRSTDSFPATSR